MSTISRSPLTDFRETNKLTLEDMAALFSPPYHRTTVMRWEKNGVPLYNVVLVEEVTGIPREQLRPDVFAKNTEARSQ